MYSLALPRPDYVAWRGAKAKAYASQRRVMKRPPPGVLAFVGEDAVGWLQIGPRADTPQWNSTRRATAPRKRERRGRRAYLRARRVLSEIVSARAGRMDALHEDVGAQFAKAWRASSNVPIDGASNMWMPCWAGSVFDRAKFTEVARRRPNRPLMRRYLRGSSKALAWKGRRTRIGAPREIIDMGLRVAVVGATGKRGPGNADHPGRAAVSRRRSDRARLAPLGGRRGQLRRQDAEGARTSRRSISPASISC